MASTLKKTKKNLELLTDIDMLLMVKKELEEKYVMQFIITLKLITNIWKIMIKIKKESTYPKYWDVNDLYGWAMSQKLPENNFDQTEDISPLNEDFTRKYNEESDEAYFFEVDVQYPEKSHELHNDLPFLLEKRKLERHEKVVGNLHDKTE